jgi:hypothetical protein
MLVRGCCNRLADDGIVPSDMKTAAITLVIFHTFLMAGCSDSGPPVHIVVPDDFKGEVVLKPTVPRLP